LLYDMIEYKIIQFEWLECKNPAYKNKISITIIYEDFYDMT